MGRTQRAMCAGMLGLQSVVLLLTVPVMLSLTEVDTAVALLIGVGLTLACLVAAGMMRRPIGGALGWAVQGASLAMGFVVPVMFVLGVAFAGFWVAAIVLGRRIDEAKAAQASAS